MTIIGAGDAIKSPKKFDRYTEDNLREFIKCKLDVEYFIDNYVYVQHPIKGAIRFDMFDYQREALYNFQNYKHNCLLWSRQLGKALSLETPILTPSGFQRLGDLNVGDKIYGRDGKETTITYITEIIQDRDCYEIEFMHGEKIIADAEHQWTYNVKTRPRIDNPKRNIVWKEVTTNTLDMIETFKKYANQTRSSNINFNITKPLVFEGKSVDIHPYVLGVWLGDGCKANGTITCADDDYIEYKKKFESLGYKISPFRRDKRSKTCGVFCVYDLVLALKKNGLQGNKHIPDNYIFNSIEIRQQLIQGLMDSDGWCAVTGDCEFYQSDKEFADKFRLILSTLGIKSTLKIKKTYRKDCYRIKFCTSAFEMFCLDRKKERQAKVLNHQKNEKFYIRSITKVESVPVRCLQVDNEDHIFLCGETLIPTHNTSLAAAYILWFSMFQKDKTVLIVANNLKTAIEIMDRIKFAYKEIPDYIRDAVLEYNKTSLVFKNGSKIVCRATTPDAGRGLSVSLCLSDESAFLRQNLQQAFWGAMRPILSTGGASIVASTPGSSEDEFSQMWRSANDTIGPNGEDMVVGKNGYKAHFADWRRHPERDEEWAAGELAAMGDERYRREHLCQFISFNSTLIDSMALERMVPKEPNFRMGQVRWWKQPEEGNSYFIALDPSLGTKADSAAIQVFEMPTMIQVAEWACNVTPPKGQVQVLFDILKYIETEIDDDPYDSSIFWSFENNSIGEAVLQTIEDSGVENFPGILISEKRPAQQKKRFRKGLNTATKNKMLACSKFKSLVDTDRLVPKSVGLIKQLKNFTANGASYSAKGAGNDDLVLAAILCVRMFEMAKNWDIFDPNLIQDNIDIDEYKEPMPFII
jgi:hypothetical protein